MSRKDFYSVENTAAVCYLHCVCFAGGCLTIGKYCPVVSLQNIWIHQDKDETLQNLKTGLVFSGFLCLFSPLTIF